MPKHRGPKTKKEREIIAQIEKLKEQLDSQPTNTMENSEIETTEAQTGKEETVNSSAENINNSTENSTDTVIPDNTQIAQLQAKVQEHNEKITLRFLLITRRTLATMKETTKSKQKIQLRKCGKVIRAMVPTSSLSLISL